MVRGPKRIIVCWAMGLTQHSNAVPTIREIVNFLLLRGNIGRPGAGRLPGPRPQQRPGRPHDGHLGADARTPSSTRSRASSASSRRASTAWTPSTRSGRCATAKVKVFFAMGGNFAAATPDTAVTEAAMRALRAHRARLDQAQPLARRHRRARR